MIEAINDATIVMKLEDVVIIVMKTFSSLKEHLIGDKRLQIEVILRTAYILIS